MAQSLLSDTTSATAQQPKFSAKDGNVQAENSGNIPMQVSGGNSMVTSYARCCHPLPGEPIMGHLSAGKGLVVHRQECSNIAELASDPERVFPLTWADQVEGDFTVALRIEAQTQRGLIAELAELVTDAEANIERIGIEERDAHLAIVNLTLAVRDRIHLARIIKRMRNLLHVERITRVLS